MKHKSRSVASRSQSVNCSRYTVSLCFSVLLYVHQHPFVLLSVFALVSACLRVPQHAPACPHMPQNAAAYPCVKRFTRFVLPSRRDVAQITIAAVATAYCPRFRQCPRGQKTFVNATSHDSHGVSIPPELKATIHDGPMFSEMKHCNRDPSCPRLCPSRF